MQPLEVQHYLSEISRVLKPNGKCLSAFFVYDDEIENAISQNNKGFSFAYKKEGYRLMNEKVSSANIAFKEKYLLDMIKSSNLKFENKIYGSWASRQNDNLFDFQDILVFRKE